MESGGSWIVSSTTLSLLKMFSASWVSAKPRRILNTEKLAADYEIENLNKYYVYSGPNRQLRIKEVK